MKYIEHITRRREDMNFIFEWYLTRENKIHILKPPCNFLFIAFDEEERILIVSFLPKSHARILWTGAAGIDRDARRFQRLGAIWTGCLAHIASISCANVFLGAVSWNLHVQ